MMQNVTLKPVDDLLTSLSEYKQTLEQYLQNVTMTSLSEDWKKREIQNLSDIVQARIKYVQNPVDCRTANKLQCLVARCGFGCQVHHILRCFLMAHGTNRTLIVHNVGWMEEYLPISDTCTDLRSVSAKSSAANTPEPEQLISINTFEYSAPPGVLFIPPYIPTDLAPRLIRIHGHPFAWWAGQFFKYLLRPKPSLAAEIEKAREVLGYRSPIVGVHVRRTDKLYQEAKLHRLSEYMSHVDTFYNHLEGERPKLVTQPRGNYSAPRRRRIYLATDEPSVLTDAIQSYPQYSVLSKSTKSHKWTDWSHVAILIDVHLLSMSDFLVCTFSSNVCRLAYEMMQSLNVDASNRVVSLDGEYYCHGQAGDDGKHVAIVAHKALGADDIDLKVGDVIKFQSISLENKLSTGTNLRTNRTGNYPSFKSSPQIRTADYPTYPAVAGNVV